jgi:hypothetical protein
MFTPLSFYDISLFDSMDNVNCAVGSVIIVPWAGGTSADYKSSDSVTEVSVNSWTTSIKITIPPISGESTRLFRFRVKATAGNVQGYSDDISVFVIDCVGGTTIPAVSDVDDI